MPLTCYSHLQKCIGRQWGKLPNQHLLYHTWSRPTSSEYVHAHTQQSMTSYTTTSEPYVRMIHTIYAVQCSLSHSYNIHSLDYTNGMEQATRLCGIFTLGQNIALYKQEMYLMPFTLKEAAEQWLVGPLNIDFHIWKSHEFTCGKDFATMVDPLSTAFGHIVYNNF